MKSAIRWLRGVIHRMRAGIVVSNAEYEAIVDRVKSVADGIECLSDEALQAAFNDFRQRRISKAKSEVLRVEALAIVREAARRSLKMRPYDVQMLAAAAMLDNKCVEMQTGEGKTLVAAVTNCINAATGYGVHVLTFNEYLAKRDARWMAPLYHFLNLTVGHIAQGMSPKERRDAYLCDITYVTAKEAVFDFLRDQLCRNLDDRVQLGFHVGLIDEADSILIDDARIPMVIATDADRDGTDLYKLAKLVSTLRKGVDFEIKAGGRNVALTDEGITLLESQLGIAELHSEAHMHMLARLNQALHAEALLRRDVDYVVRSGSVELIDEFTGRIAENRKWPGGLQAALEAKENLEIQPQGKILNTITMQQFVAQYEKLAGMTGTAAEAADEFDDFYCLKVVVVPTNRPSIRVDHEDRIFSTKLEKLQALVMEVKQHYSTGRPVLIGTASIVETQILEQALFAANVPCRVLNANNDHLEAEIIAEAGSLGSVTISTNMAGRGTDIRLGGAQQSETEKVVAFGGLYVIGTNRHESRRIDNQLRGRAGRQGDPGETCFFISLEDDLIAQHGIADVIAGHAVTHKSDNQETGKRIAQVQRIIEGECFEIRRTLRSYSLLLDVQRKAVSADREKLLHPRNAPTTLLRLDPKLRERLIVRWGETIVNESERMVALHHIDWCWSEHLVHAGEIRENIHLASYGGFNPQDLFNQQMNREFRDFQTTVESKTLATLRNATFTADGIDLEREGLQAPSSTWTFMINDNPRGAILNVLTHGILRRLGLARHGGAIETTADLRRADSDKQQQTTDRFEQN